MMLFHFSQRRIVLSTLFGLTFSTALSAQDIPYAVEYHRDGLVFERANTREQDFGVELNITGPNDFHYQQRFTPGEAVSFTLLNQRGQIIADGRYNYELSLLSPLRQRINTPNISDPNKLNGARQSGVFTIAQGYLASPESNEGGNTRDVIIADDQIVQGSICAGLDCVNGESFDFDAIRLKENNLRIRFDDTSISASFPNTDWELVANDTTNGGANRFSIEDLSAASVPFTVEGGSPNHSLFVDNSGRVGFGTSTPLLDIHILSSNTPALRLDQDSGGGFPAQVWDIGGNESEFFVRDSNQFTLPLRILPGAPSNSISVDGNGNVGLGTASPAAELHLQRLNNGPSIAYESVGSPNRRWESGVNDGDGDFRIDDTATPATELVSRAGGNLEIAGTLISMRAPELPKLDQRQTQMSLSQLQAYIARNQQLPGFSGNQTGIASKPGIHDSAAGHDVVAFQMQLLQQLQQLTLYTLQQEQRIQQLEAELAKQR